jgi:hypothetical protein
MEEEGNKRTVQRRKINLTFNVSNVQNLDIMQVSVEMKRTKIRKIVKKQI